MRRNFRDSIKLVEADIQHANTLASEFPREYDGACLQMRMSYSLAAPLFLFLVQWTDCHLAGALGLLRILIYKVYVDGTTTMSIHERKASIREFYEDKEQKALCREKYRKREIEEEEEGDGHCSEVNAEGEEECGICMEIKSKVVLPDCNHAMCLECYRECHARSQACPFCRDSLKRVNSGDLWVFLDGRDAIELTTFTSENLKRLFNYVDKLPLIIPDALFDSYSRHSR